MRITDIQEQKVSIASDIRNAYIDFSKMDVSVVAVYTDAELNGKPLVGYGFNSNGRYSQSGILRERIIPRILAAADEELLDETGGNLDPERIWNVMMRNEKPGGHGERSVAVGVIDMAIWDVVAKHEGKPLYRVLAERFNDGQADDEVFVYAAGGYYYPGKEIESLLEEMQSYLDMGYSTVKMKIGGASLAEDLRRIDAVLELVSSPEKLAVDANGRFDLETAKEYGQALEPYGVRWYEEAGDPLDYELQAVLSEAYSGPLATGENLFSHQDVRNLLRYGGMRSGIDILQMDPVLSYGLVEYRRMLAVLEDMGWSTRNCIPHGGHQFALNIAAGLSLGGNESYPHVFAPFGGFADSTPVEDSYVKLPDAPGIGFEEKEELFELLQRTFA